MTNKKRNPEEDATIDAHKLGSEVGMLMAGAMMKLDLLPHVGPVFNGIQSSPMFDEFSKSFVTTLVKASKSGSEGVRARADLAYRLHLEHAEMCRRATEYALAHQGQGGEKILMKLHHMVESARSCGRAADALFAPIDQNLTNLLESGRQILTIQQMRQQHEAAEMATQLAHQHCDDAHCPVHSKN